MPYLGHHVRGHQSFGGATVHADADADNLFSEFMALICGQGIHLCQRLRATCVHAITVVSQCMGYTQAAKVYTSAY